MPSNNDTFIPVLSAGFRLFFPGAALFATTTIALFSASYFGVLPLPIDQFTVFQWHAHEMVFGYTVAVIAGFLLTAVANWTGVRTVQGGKLGLLFGLWVGARIAFAGGDDLMVVAALLDMLFSCYLIYVVTAPVVAARQWRQMAVVSKLALIAVLNGVFYLGVFGLLERGIVIGVYGGLYLVIGLILTLGRRVIPGFIERGVGYPVTLRNSVLLDRLSLVFFLGFFLVELFTPFDAFSAILTLGLFIVNASRLVGWYTRGIWSNALLWSLYLALWFICLGFLLHAGSVFTGMSPYLAVHAFAFGGIGVITMSMMARVSWGHTGRDVTRPPGAVRYALVLLVVGAVTRVVMPLIIESYYTLWIGLSQLMWVSAFAWFLICYLPVWTRSRIPVGQEIK